MVAHEEGGRVGPLGRLAIEDGPLGVFFLGNQLWHVMAATALFMAATFVSVAVSYRLERRWPLMPLVAGAFVLVFGGLWGFWGVFFAIPLATVVQSILKAWPRPTTTLVAG